MAMKVLLIGSGGREHAIAWKLKQSCHLKHLFCAPGNAGIASIATCVPIKADDIKELLSFAIDMKVELTVVGPEAPLSMGIVDAFHKEGLPIFGPSRAAAQMEASKSFAKTIMRRMGIPTGAARRCTDLESALAALDEFTPPFVVKADGLASGKGVTIAASRAEAEEAVRACMESRVFGDAGNLVLMEEFLEGEEVSVFALADGERVLPMQPAQDHKRVDDGDRGPNTGGMGAYSPVPHLEGDIVSEAVEKVLAPAVKGLAQQGTPYRGLLYAGLIKTESGLKVIEFNCRFGDPETQVILPRLEDDLLLLMMECVGTGLQRRSIKFSDQAATCVVAASGGYPGSYESGHQIEGIAEAEKAGALVFHAGTAAKDGRCLTAGGRVLNVVGTGPDLQASTRRAYEAMEMIRFKDIHYRRDIAHRVLKRRASRP